MKFWASLIVGTIAISAFLTYLNLYKGAQTLEFPPLPPKTIPGKIEFAKSPLERKIGPPLKMEILANTISFDAGTSYVGQESEAGVMISNVGESTLELSLRDKTCDCAQIFVDSKEITNTNHEVKLPPKSSAKFRIVWKPELKQITEPNDKARIRASFTHNDDRYSDLLHFEIVTTVRVNR